MKSRPVDVVKFYFVGLVGMGVQLAVLTLLRSGLQWTIRLSTTVAVECAVLQNFVWHERWTWAHRRLEMRGIPGRLFRFNVSNGLISLIGNLIFMEILAVRLHLNYFFANVVAIGACALLNFIISDKLVFK